MKKPSIAAALALLAVPVFAQESEETPETFPSPNEIVAEAAQEEWVAIAPEDLLVMDLAEDAEGNARRVIIQLMPAPFSQGWVENIRTLAKAHWWDGTNVYRVQDNYVTQWGGGALEKAEPEGLNVVPESEYAISLDDNTDETIMGALTDEFEAITETRHYWSTGELVKFPRGGSYADANIWAKGWPIASNEDVAEAWPTHCYGMVGVARGMSPNTGSGGDLYTVIGHAPRHLDRNIALVGRVIEGIEHLSSLPRGKGTLGFYDDDEADKRVPILSVRLGSELLEIPQPQFEYLSTESESFARYAEARANRRDPFFLVPAGGADICNIPVPMRRIPGE